MIRTMYKSGTRWLGSDHFVSLRLDGEAVKRP